MDTNNAINSFSALSQETRLDVFRLMVKAGSKGMLAGDIADELSTKQNTMSANLSVLTQAGLLKKEREGRNIRYFADFNGLAQLLTFLMEDCCGGQPEMCKPFIEKILKCC